MNAEIFYYFWLGLFGVFLLIQVLQWLQSRTIHNRYKKFKRFEDYDRFKDLINPKLSLKLLVFANSILVLTLIAFGVFLFIDFQVFQYYFFMVIPVLVSDASIIYHEYSRKFQQLNLEEIDTAYYQIDGIITNTDRYVSERQAVIKEINEYMEETKNELAPLLGKSSSALFTSIIEDLNAKKAALQSKIDNLQDNITSLKTKFLDALSKKLQNEEVKFSKLFKSTSMDASEQDIPAEIHQIRRATEEKIAQAIASYISMAEKLPLPEIQTVFHTFSKFTESVDTDIVLNILDKMSIEPSERDILTEVLFTIPSDIVQLFKKFFIPRDINWVYSHSFNEHLNASQKRAVYKELMHQKATRSLQTILASLDPLTLSEMDELSHLVDVDPMINEKIQRYQKITETLYQSFNTFNAAENIYIILSQIKSPLSDTQDFLKANPFAATDLNQHAEAIFALYHREFSQISRDVIDIIETMDVFASLQQGSRSSLFNWKTLETFILENAALIQPDYVLVGFGLFLVDLEKSNLLSQAKQLPEWAQNTFKQLLKNYDINQDVDVERLQATGRFDKNLLNHARFNPFKDRLPNIIMRIENERMTLNDMAI